ncbi:MAG: trimethylamine methyltransferase family protein, partial [Dethiobacteria bacterium]|nr:trimethylamine methyltransferase family protein [Dethiobacteria bacterium]
GTVSTIANMRLGTVALGSVETGLISAASAQLARRYRLPIRSVGAATESKVEDIQAGLERSATLMQAALAGVNYITCGGTLDSTMLESEALLLLDDEWCGAIQRAARGIEVNQQTMALALIKQTGFSGHYLAEEHTAEHFRKEHYIPELLVREPHSSWIGKGSKTALDLAREKVDQVLAAHQPKPVDRETTELLDAYCAETAARELEHFYLSEQEENQDFSKL